jgi:hypothetical protein
VLTVDVIAKIAKSPIDIASLIPPLSTPGNRL